MTGNTPELKLLPVEEYKLLGVPVVILEMVADETSGRINYYAEVSGHMLPYGMLKIESAKHIARELIVSILNHYTEDIKQTSEEIASTLKEISEKKMIETENRGEDFHD